MALANRHWVGLMIVGCLVVAAALLPPQPPERLYATWPTSQTWADRAEEALRRSVDRLVQARRIDSLLSEADRLGARPGGPAMVLVDRRLPPSVRELSQRLVGGFTNAMANRSEETRIVVGVVLDSGGSVDGLPRFTYGSPQRTWRPDETDSVTCLVTIPIDAWRMNTIQRGLVTPRSLDWRTSGGLLGQCAFYASYGVPGTQVARWLDLHQGYIAEGVNPANVTSEPPARSREWSSGVSGRPPSISLNAMMTVLGNGYWYWWPAGVIGREACVAGVLKECRSALFEDPYAGVRRSWWSWRWWRNQHPLGPYGDFFLADMELDLGRDAFARFWNSELPVDSAFYEVAGLPIEEWTLDWLQAQASDVPPPGPALRAGSVVLSLLVAGLAVGGSAWVAMRRSLG